MDVSPQLAEDFMKCLKNVWQSQEFADFTVKAEDVSFKCHRVILSACSHFFKGLLQTNMQEAASGCVEVKNVSATTLELMLKMVYTGENLLTDENFLEVWRAVHQLQMDHLIKCCEEFAVKALSIENFEEVYKHGQILNSSSVQDETTRFMLKEFSFVRTTKTFLELSFKDLISLVKSQQLNINTEDIVLESVLKWIEFFPNSDNAIHPLVSDDTDQQGLEKNVSFCKTQCPEEKYETSESSKVSNTQDDSNSAIRHHLLIDLLKAVRMCLVSPTVLDTAFKHKLVANSVKAREIIFNALKYHVCGFRLGQWPAAALHRVCSEFVNVGVTAFGKGKFKALSFVDGRWYDISECEDVRRNALFQMAATNDNIYFINNLSNSGDTICVYELREKKWQKVRQLTYNDADYLLLAHGSLIYVLETCKYRPITYQIDLKRGTQIEIKERPDGGTLEHAMIYGNYIIMYCSTENENNVDETAVYVLDRQSQVYTKLNNLIGPAEALISFRNDENTFILQSNGSLSVIEGSLAETISFKLIAQLWDFKRDSLGAITQGDILYIVTDNRKADPADKIKMTSVHGYFSRITYIGISGNKSNFIPVVLPKAELA